MEVRVLKDCSKIPIERKIMQSRLFFLFFLFFRNQTHTNKEIFKLHQFWPSRRPFSLSYSQFWLSVGFLFNLTLIFAKILSRNDFKSTKRRSMKKISTNTATGSQIYSQLVNSWCASRKVSSTIWGWRFGLLKICFRGFAEFSWIRKRKTAAVKYDIIFGRPESSRRYFIQAFAKLLKLTKEMKRILGKMSSFLGILLLNIKQC